MRHVLILLILVAASVTASITAGPALAGPDCGGAAPCPIGARTYSALPPPGWDGVTPLPVLLHFHGWGRRGVGVIRNKRVTQAAAEAGALLLAPQGEGRSWSFWSPDSRDSDFALAVIEDAARRWPIDRERIVVSGFSYGGAMAWRMACDHGAVVRAYLPMAGSLWRGDEDCRQPVRISHVHGLKDTVMDYPYGADGTPESAVDLWRAENRCPSAPDQRIKVGMFDCRRWTSCAAGPEVELCTHPYGHMIPKKWLSYALPRALGK